MQNIGQYRVLGNGSWLGAFGTTAEARRWAEEKQVGDGWRSVYIAEFVPYPDKTVYGEYVAILEGIPVPGGIMWECIAKKARKKYRAEVLGRGDVMPEYFSDRDAMGSGACRMAKEFPNSEIMVYLDVPGEGFVPYRTYSVTAYGSIRFRCVFDKGNSNENN